MTVLDSRSAASDSLCRHLRVLLAALAQPGREDDERRLLSIAGLRLLDRLSPLTRPFEQAAIEPRSSDSYAETVRRFGLFIGRVTEPETTIAVISKGDDDLLVCTERRLIHFPADADGRYAGYHPADGQAAVAELLKAQARGARYLAIPEPSLWWLEYYAELRSHLEQGAQTVASDPATGIVFHLCEPHDHRPRTGAR